VFRIFVKLNLFSGVL